MKYCLAICVTVLLVALMKYSQPLLEKRMDLRIFQTIQELSNVGKAQPKLHKL